MPRVSVILNCYNHEQYVTEAVESVLAQTFTDLELILIDNGSTDSSRAILDRHDDPRVHRLYFDSNESLSKRLNQGVAAARGEFVAILYSDDMMLLDKLERQVALFDRLPTDYGVTYCPPLVFDQYSGARWINRSMGVSGDILAAMLKCHFEGAIDMCSPLTRRACFLQNPWHEDLFGDGEAVFFRVATEWKFHFDALPTVMLRNHESNMGKAIRVNGDMHLEILRRLERDSRLTQTQLRALSRHRARYCINTGWSYARLGGSDRAWVLAKLRQAMRSNILAIFLPRFAASLFLALLPDALRRRANALGDRLKPSAGTKALIEDL